MGKFIDMDALSAFAAALASKVKTALSAKQDTLTAGTGITLASSDGGGVTVSVRTDYPGLQVACPPSGADVYQIQQELEEAVAGKQSGPLTSADACFSGKVMTLHAATYDEVDRIAEENFTGVING